MRRSWVRFSSWAPQYNRFKVFRSTFIWIERSFTEHLTSVDAILRISFWSFMKSSSAALAFFRHRRVADMQELSSVQTSEYHIISRIISHLLGLETTWMRLFVWDRVSAIGNFGYLHAETNEWFLKLLQKISWLSWLTKNGSLWFAIVWLVIPRCISISSTYRSDSLTRLLSSLDLGFPIT